MHLGSRLPLQAVCLALGATSLLAQGKLYYVQNQFGPDVVVRTDLDGSNAEAVVTGLNEPSDITVDPTGGKIYWTDSNLIRRANLDGTGVETVISTSGAKRGLAVDSAADRLYWGNTNSQKIRRATLSGANPQDLVVGLDFPADIELDPAGGKMYWSEQNARTISRANLDGTGVEVLHTNGSWGLELDLFDQRIYWANSVQSTIFSSDLDGSNMTIVRLTVGSDVTGMSIDPVVGKLYWVGTGPSRLQRMNLDGTGLETVVPALNTPLGIEVDVSACPPPTLSATSPYGCGVNTVDSLTVLEGSPRFGRDFILGVDNPLGTQPAGSIPLLFVATAPDPAFPCGTVLGGFGMAGPAAPGELLVRPPWFVLFGAPWTGPGNPAPFDLTLPAACVFSGLDLYVQSALFDPGGSIDLGLGEAMVVTFGR